MPKTMIPFWKTKSLAEMTHEEWESLCDRCGRCCLEKLEDQDSGQVFYTCVACPLLDAEQCCCKAYGDRTRLMPDCLVLTPAHVGQFYWLPGTCAYRLLAEGKDLEWWHPLISGNADTVHQAGISVRGKIVAAQYVNAEDLEAYIIAF
jgi:hypothetical protein